jgi:hypothetical protein
MLHRRNSASSGDAVEAEAAARAHRAMIEKAQAKERQAQEKTSADESAPNIEWGKSGVAGLLDEDLDVNAVSGTETLKNKKGGAVPVGTVSRAPPKTSLGWEPQVRSEVEIAAPTPYPVTEAMEQSIQFLTESLKSERKRADDINDRRLQLEAENAALRQELRLAQDKVFKAMFPDSM